MAGAHQHAAFFRHQRKHVTGPHEISGAHIAVGKRANCVGPLFRGDARGQAVADIDRYRKRGAERRIVARHHRVEMQPPRFIRRQRRADDTGRIADDERHLLGRAQRSRNKQIAFVLAVVVVGDDDDFAAGKCGHGRADALVSVFHYFLPLTAAVPSK